MADHNELGIRGEKIALEYLKNKGYRIERLNWRFQKAEIDIIAWHKNYFVIIEVKTRSSTTFENPKEAVTLNKQKHLIRAAEAYILEKNIEKECRFDIVSVLIQGAKVEIEHIEDAFYPI